MYVDVFTLCACASLSSFFPFPLPPYHLGNFSFLQILFIFAHFHISGQMEGVAGSLESKSKRVVHKMASSSSSAQNALQVGKRLKGRLR